MYKTEKQLYDEEVDREDKDMNRRLRRVRAARREEGTGGAERAADDPEEGDEEVARWPPERASMAGVVALQVPEDAPETVVPAPTMTTATTQGEVRSPVRLLARSRQSTKTSSSHRPFARAEEYVSFDDLIAQSRHEPGGGGLLSTGRIESVRAASAAVARLRLGANAAALVQRMQLLDALVVSKRRTVFRPQRIDKVIQVGSQIDGIGIDRM